MSEAKNPLFVTVDLDQPIQRGDQTIDKIKLRRPGAGEMRGLAMLSLLQMDMGAVQTILPRISDPPIYAADIAGMDVSDLFALAGEVANFLLTRKSETGFPQA